ncbi:MAG TPA: ATP-binding protein, partial [Candidatus Nanopelagicales bacterium]|nr:ATP-binding protein [Candidatus Nanopelagicales bacterium]
IEECLSNAFRHGVAQRVTVVMRNEGDAWLVQVSDDGSGFSPTSTTGLGSSLLDAVSGGDWSRVAGDDGGCVVTVRVPEI